MRLRTHTYTQGDVPKAATMLAKAFRDYPLLAYAIPDVNQRAVAAYHYCSYVLYYGIRYGEAYATSAHMEAVAVWLSSEYFPMSMWRTIRAVPLSVIGGFGKAGGSRLKNPSQYIDARHEALTPFNHWNLLFLGVAPERQGQGYSSLLRRPMLARFDDERLPCFLETMDARNVPRYQHFGFQIIEKSLVPGTELSTWAMLRDGTTADSRTS